MPKPKLTAEDAREIYTSTELVPRLAERFGVSRSLVRGIKYGMYWWQETADLDKGAAPRGRPKMDATTTETDNA